MPDGSERPDARSDEKKRRKLGMDRPITRREFIDGILIGAGAITASGWLEACTSSGGDSGTSPSAGATPSGSGGAAGSTAYPPSLTGLRGTVLSESSVMHSLRDGAPWDYLGSPSVLNESYDLIVVGGGISGLSSAFFYQQEHGADARILIVDPLDDFGGHARRNEFTASNGRKLIGWGGSGNLDGPAHFSPVVLQMLDDVGVHYKQFLDYGKQTLYSDLGLKNAIYFEEEAWGRGHLTWKNQNPKDMLKDAPMAEQAKQDLVMLMESLPDYFPGLTDEQKKTKLLDLTYLDFLTKFAKVHPDVIKYLFNISSGEWSTGIDLFVAWRRGSMGIRVSRGMGLDYNTSKPPYGVSASTVEYWDYVIGKLESDPILFMFPDGNHGVASALVRRLIPDVLDGSDMPSLTTGTAR